MTGSAEETAKKVFGVSGNTRRLGGGMRQCRKVFGSAKKSGIFRKLKKVEVLGA